MTEFFGTITEYWPGLTLRNVVSAFVIFFGGFLLSRAAKKWITLRRLSPNRQQLVRRFVHYGILIVALALALDTVGVNLGVVLGAAGVFTVAVGFAARTSLSNLISGLFLMAEEPFQVGDSIEVAGVTGDVVSVGLLAMTIRTLDNRLVRIPSESVFNGVLQNMNAFAIRRVEVETGVGYGSDLKLVEATLLRAADECPLVLKSPAPLITASGFGELSIEVTVGVWCKVEDMRETRLALMDLILKAFAAAKIEIPVPCRNFRVGKGEPTIAVDV